MSKYLSCENSWVIETVSPVSVGVWFSHDRPSELQADHVCAYPVGGERN